MASGFDSMPDLYEQFAGICCKPERADVWFKFTSRNGHSERIPGHKWFLALRCPKYTAEFGEDWINSKDKADIEINYVSAEAFRVFMHFIYEGKCEFEVKLATEVLDLAKMYMLKDLWEKAIQKIKDNLNFFDASSLNLLENLLSIGEKDSEIYTQCMKLIATNANKAVKHESFLQLNSQTLTLILKQQKMNIKEVDLCLALIKWAAVECQRCDLEVNESNKKQVLMPFSQYLRFPTMNYAEIARVMGECQLLSEKDLGKLLLGKENERFRAGISWSFTPRTTYFKREKILIIGGWNGKNDVCDIREYKPETGAQIHSAKLRKSRREFTAALIDDRIFVFGGCSSNKIVEKSSEVWNPKDAMSTTRFISKMPLKCRMAYSACSVVEGKVYLFGSRFDKNGRSSLCYDVVSDSWKVLMDIPINTNMASAWPITSNQGILVIGGNVNGCVFSYDIKENRWEEKVQMKLPKPIYFAGVVELNDGSIVICGGNSPTNNRTDVTNKCWRLPLNGNKWVPFPALQNRRAVHSVLMYNGMILVIGGEDPQGKPIKSVEIYTDGQWKYATELDVPLCGFRAIIYPE